MSAGDLAESKDESRVDIEKTIDSTDSCVKKFATTVRLQSDPSYAARARVLPIPNMLPNSKYRLLDEWRIFFMLLQALFREKSLLLYTSRGRFKPELLATILAGFLPRNRRPKIVSYGDLFQPSDNIRGPLERLLMRLADWATKAYIVYTEAERDLFFPTWHISKEKIHVIPYFINTDRHTSAEQQDVSRHIFAGGNSFRDFETLLAAARELPDYEFVFCTGSLSGHQDIPPHIRTGYVSLQEYVHLIKSAAAVIIPVQTGLKRTAGMQTCFDSMWLKKLTIVTDALGIREYVIDGETALIVDGSAESYREAISWVMDPANETAVATMGEKAHHAVGQFTIEKHVRCLLDVMDMIIAESLSEPEGATQST